MQEDFLVSSKFASFICKRYASSVFPINQLLEMISTPSGSSLKLWSLILKTEPNYQYEVHCELLFIISFLLFKYIAELFFVNGLVLSTNKLG